QMPSAEKPQSRAGRDRFLPAVSLQADRGDPAEGDLRARDLFGSDPSSNGAEDLGAAGTLSRAPRCGRGQGPPDLPPRLPPPKPGREKAGLGRSPDDHGRTEGGLRGESGMKQLWAPWRIDYIKGEKPSGCILCEK